MKKDTLLASVFVPGNQFSFWSNDWLTC